MSDKERIFWESLGQWLRSESGGRNPNQEFSDFAQSSADLGRQILHPESPIWTDTNSDEGLLIIGLFVGAVIAFKGGKYLLGIDWFSLVILVVIGCAASVIVSEIWRFYIQPFLSCIL